MWYHVPHHIGGGIVCASARSWHRVRARSLVASFALARGIICARSWHCVLSYHMKVKFSCWGGLLCGIMCHIHWWWHCVRARSLARSWHCVHARSLVASCARAAVTAQHCCCINCASCGMQMIHCVFVMISYDNSACTRQHLPKM